MPTKCRLLGELVSSAGAPIPLARVTFTPRDGAIRPLPPLTIVPEAETGRTDENGQLLALDGGPFEVYPGVYSIRVKQGLHPAYPTMTGTVPEAETALLSDIQNLTPPVPLNEAQLAVLAAQQARDQAVAARVGIEEAEGRAAQSAADADGSAQAAGASAGAAAGSAGAAGDAAGAAAGSAAAAAADRTQTGEDRAAVAADRSEVETLRSAVAGDRTQTGEDRGAAAASAAAALGSENAAAGSAGEAAGSAAAAAASEETAAQRASEAAADRLQTGQDRAATAADRQQTALDRSATAADRAATSADREQTNADMAAVGAARDAAIDAAELSGDVLFFDTYAAASAALAGVADLQVVRVLADETRNAEQEFYRKEGGALVHKPVARSPRVFFVSDTGLDSNTGFDPSARLLTLSAAAARARAGDRVMLAKGSVFRGGSSFVAGVTVETDGSGERPIISGQDVVTAFTAYEGGPAYTFTVDLPAGTAARAYPGMWEDGRRAKEVKVGDAGIANAAAARAAVVAAAAPTFYFDGPGSYAAGWSAGVKTYYFNPGDGTNPNANGRLYEVYARPYAGGGAAHFKGVRFHSGFHHDGTSASMEDCSIERLARHGNLPSVPNFKRVTVIGPNPAYLGGGYFHSNPTSLAADVVYEEDVAVGDETLVPRVGIGFYTHGTGSPVRNRATLLRSKAIANAIAVAFTDVLTVDILDFVARGNDQHVAMQAGQTVNLINGDMRGGRGGVGDGGRQTIGHTADNQLNIRGGYFDWLGQRFFESGGIVRNIIAEDAMLVVRPSRISGNDGAFTRSTGALTNLKLHRSVIVNAGDIAALEWLAIATSAAGCEFRDLLIVGQASRSGTVRRGECQINGATVPVTSVDPLARVFGIDRARALLSDGPEGIRLRDGHYRPGDFVFNACAVSPGDSQPRAYVIVGDRVISSETSTFQIMPAFTYTPPQLMRGAAHMATGGRFIAVGDVGTFIRSGVDSSTGWAAITTGVTDNLQACAASGAVIVAVGEDGCVIRSEDSGATWAEVLNGGARYTAQDLFAIACNGSTWIAAGAAGTVLRSTDNGVTWAVSTVGTRGYRACYRSALTSLFLIGGDGGELRTSTDGASWTVRSTGTVNNIRSIAESDGEIIGVMFQASRHTDTFIRSTNGADWTVLPDTLPFEVVGVAGAGAQSTISGHHNLFCVGEAQAMGWRRHGGWNVQRIGASEPQMGVDTMDDWLKRVR